MANSSDILKDGFERIRDTATRVVDGLTPSELAARPGAEANSIVWLIWHLTRVQDDHLSGAGAGEQLWIGGEWSERFALPFDEDATGYGQSSEDVARLAGVDSSLLIGYLHEVTAQTLAFLDSLSDEDLDRVVDEDWDPPVTLAVRLVSVLADDLQHVGQAAFVRGLL